VLGEDDDGAALGEDGRRARTTNAALGEASPSATTKDTWAVLGLSYYADRVN
jgi:hypothetical protein